MKNTNPIDQKFDKVSNMLINMKSKILTFFFLPFCIACNNSGNIENDYHSINSNQLSHSPDSTGDVKQETE